MANEIDNLIRQRIAEAMNDRQQTRGNTISELSQLKHILGSGGGGGGYSASSNPSSGSVMQQQGAGMTDPSQMPQTMGQGVGPSVAPEDYNYFVDINRRDVFEPDESGELQKVGWDKAVHRWADPRNKEPRLGDLTDDGMKAKDKKKSRKVMQSLFDDFQQGDE